MAKRLKNYVGASFFHIMIQGLNKEYIFNNDIDKRKYLYILKNIKKEVNVNIIAYCVMDNHIHFLMNVDDINELSKIMQRCNTTYAKYYNKKYDRVGYVFRNRFKSQVIYSEKQLYSCINYIHNNPVKAKMCQHPNEYRYSSFEYYNNNIKLLHSYLRADKFINNKEDIVLLEVEEDIEEEIQNIINTYLEKSHLTLKELSKNKDNLKEIVFLLKNNYNISIRKISENINVGREIIRQIINNGKN